MRRKLANPDAVVAQIASRQHGVVTLAQLYWAGLSHTGVRRRTQAGRLHRIHRGVYAVGVPNLTREGTWFAAVAACGPGAVLSHQSAGALWQLSPFTSAVVHVTVPTSAGRAKRKGIVIHRSRTLTKRDTTRRHNIAVTTLARTQADLGFGPERTRSELERAFLRLLKAHDDIPKPEVNQEIGPFKVDFLWRPERVIVEIDSWKYHRSRASFESDRARDRELTLRGFETLRFTDLDVVRRGAETARSLFAQLERSSSNATSST